MQNGSGSPAGNRILSLLPSLEAAANINLPASVAYLMALRTMAFSVSPRNAFRNPMESEIILTFQHSVANRIACGDQSVFGIRDRI